MAAVAAQILIDHEGGKAWAEAVTVLQKPATSWAALFAYVICTGGAIKLEGAGIILNAIEQTEKGLTLWLNAPIQSKVGLIKLSVSGKGFNTSNIPGEYVERGSKPSTGSIVFPLSVSRSFFDFY